MQKQFVYDVVLGASDLCNLKQEADEILSEIQRGRRLVIYGRRNTGKTSLIQTVVIERFLAKKKGRFAVNVDFMGVTSLTEIQKRIRIAFERGLSKAHPSQSFLTTLMKSLRGIRPTMTVSPVTGELSFSFGIDLGAPEPSLETLFTAIKHYHAAHSALIVFDEFQDITSVPEAQALLRAALQQLPSDLPVIILGSQKHLLAEIFALPRAPLAGWGRDIQIPDLESPPYQKQYHAYIQERFDSEKLKISLETAVRLMEKARYIPETVNVVCDVVLSNKVYHSKEIRFDAVLKAFQHAVEQRRGRYEERLSHLRVNEQDVLIAIAKFEPVEKLKGKEFLRVLSHLSPTSVYKITKNLDHRSELHETEKGYVLGDALFAEYLRQYR